MERVQTETSTKFTYAEKDKILYNGRHTSKQAIPKKVFLKDTFLRLLYKSIHFMYLSHFNSQVEPFSKTIRHGSSWNI